MRTNRNDYQLHADTLASRERIARPAGKPAKTKRPHKSTARHLAARAARALQDIFGGEA